MIGHLSHFLLAIILLFFSAFKPTLSWAQESEPAAPAEEVTVPPEVIEKSVEAPPSLETPAVTEDPPSTQVEVDPVDDIPQDKIPAPKPIPPQLRYQNGDSPYQVPTYFDPTENGVEFKPMVFEYDLTKRNELAIGPFNLSAKTFFVELGTLKSLAPEISSAKDVNLSQQVLAIHWPRAFSEGGILEVVSWTGEVLWSVRVGPLQKRIWELKLEEWSDRKKARSSLFSSTFGVPDFSVPEKWFSEKGPFRFCLTKDLEGARGRLCSGRHVFKKTGDLSKLTYNPERIPPRVVLGGKAVALKKQFKVDTKGRLLSFFAELEDGISYEFASIPKRPQLVDFVRSNDNQFHVIMGYGLKPVYEDTIELNAPDPKLFWNLIGWQQTIGDMRRFWRVAVPKTVQSIFMRGEGGGIFRQDLEFKQEPPLEAARVWLDKTTPQTTASWSPWFEAWRPPGYSVASSEEKVFQDKKNSDFEWKFRASKSMAMNKSRLKIRAPDKTNYVAHYEVYRGSFFDIGVRLSGALAKTESGTEMLLIGEGSFAFWPENILGWDNHYVSRQRWGFTGRFFQSFSSASIASSGDSEARAQLNKIKLVSNNFDVRYRFTPGVWGRDETWGALAGLSDQQVFAYKARFLGVGFFWARSMPQIFDNIFNIIPYLRYPKFVDLDFTYYPTALSTGTTPLLNFILNFHGKIMWTKSFYGEAGFGWRWTNFHSMQNAQYDEKGVLRGRGVTFISAYGLAGLGYSF